LGVSSLKRHASEFNDNKRGKENEEEGRSLVLLEKRNKARRFTRLRGFFQKSGEFRGEWQEAATSAGRNSPKKRGVQFGKNNAKLPMQNLGTPKYALTEVGIPRGSLQLT